MDYEKKYKEALEWARKVMQGKVGFVLDDVLEKFPELAESEDERIRKEIIAFLTYYHTGQGNSVKYDDNWIAWLEKQGEQKSNYNNKELKDVVIAELSKYNSNDLNVPWAIDSTGLQYPLYFANLGAKWQGEQKSACAWSEEDEKKLLCVCAWIKDYPRIADFKDEMYTVANNYINWLKSLKGRVQPKQEWSEEDIVAIDCAVEVLSKDLPSLAASIERLKSLRPQWKPNEEMLEALYRAIPKNVMEISEDEMLLDKLYQGLKYGRVLSEK